MRKVNCVMGLWVNALRRLPMEIIHCATFDIQAIFRRLILYVAIVGVCVSREQKIEKKPK